MTFFTVAFWVLAIGICLGIVVGAVIFAFAIVLMIYAVPYSLWIGTQNLHGKQLERKKEESLLRIVRNATRLYKSWITKKEPVFLGPPAKKS